MKSGKCPKCNSTEVYKSKGALGGRSQTVYLTTSGEDNFEVEAYVCLSCRHIEMFALETAGALWGKGKDLTETVTKSDKWEKVNR